MKKINIVLKSGNVIEVECEGFGVDRDRKTNSIVTLTWVQATPNIMFIDLKEIAAVIELNGDARKQPVK